MKSNIYKRPDTGKWVMRTMVDGERFTGTLGNGSQRWAQKAGDELLVNLLEERKPTAVCCTVKGLLDLWERYAESGRSRRGRLAKTTVRQAKNAFEAIAVLGAGLSMESDLYLLTPAAVREWHGQELNKVARVSGQRRMASIYAKWVQAKSLIGQNAVIFYADQGLDVRDWARDLREVSLPKGKLPTYDNPAEALVRKTEKAGSELKESDPVLWIIYTLAINCGLRAGEIAAMRKDWVTESRGVLGIALIDRGYWTPKWGTERFVPIHKNIWEDICKFSAGRDTVLPGKDYKRYDLVTKDFAQWIKGLGWQTQKKAHELRKLFGSRVYTDLDPAWAKEYLGHDSLDTTTKFYAKLDRPWKLIEQR